MADAPNFTPHDSDGLVAPIVAGALIQNLLFGVLIVVFCRFVGSSGWARQSRTMKTVIVVVCLLTMASSGLYMHDVFFYSLTFTNDLGVLVRSTVAEGVEPVLVGVIGAVVQQTLAMRASRLIATSWVRWLYRIVIGLGSTLALLSSIGVTVCSIAFTVEPVVTATLPFPIQLAQFIQAWAWASAATDALISASYIAIIRIRVKADNDVAKSVLRLVCRYVLESALYTTVFALASAITVDTTDPDDPAQYDLSYVTWMPCSSLYALSLFTTLSIADRVRNKMSGWPHRDRDRHSAPLAGSSAVGRDISLAGSFFTSTRGAYLPPQRRRGSSLERKAPLESMVTKPGEPAWEQRTTSFLGVRIPLALEDDLDGGGYTGPRGGVDPSPV